jgi:hypothetical protein
MNQPLLPDRNSFKSSHFKEKPDEPDKITFHEGYFKKISLNFTNELPIIN